VTVYSNMQGALKSVTLSSTGTLTFIAVTAWEIKNVHTNCAWTFTKFSGQISFPASPIAGGPVTVTARRIAGSCASTCKIKAYGEVQDNSTTPLTVEVV
jgi:hypothetical protein